MTDSPHPLAASFAHARAEAAPAPNQALDVEHDERMLSVCKDNMLPLPCMHASAYVHSFSQIKGFARCRTPQISVQADMGTLAQ